MKYLQRNTVDVIKLQLTQLHMNQNETHW